MVTEQPAASSRRGATPVVIRGESPRSQQFDGQISVDTLSFTIPFKNIFDFLDTDPVSTHPSLHLKSVLAEFAQKLFGLSLDGGFRGGKNFFHSSINFASACGFMAFGGNNVHVQPDGTVITKEERLQVYLTGAGCERLGDASALYEPLLALGCDKLARFDAALDDFNGCFDIEFAKELYHQHAFTTNGRPPKAKLIDDFGSGDGKTFYVGNRAHGKLLRVYEKGKQLGDRFSRWVRWEVEFVSKGREVPLAALLDPLAFFIGAYPKALSFVDGLHQVIKTTREKVRITYKKLRETMVRQYGKLLYFAVDKLCVDPMEIYNEFKNEAGLPKRLKWMDYMTPTQILST